MTTFPKLLTPLKLGNYTLKNRVLMASMTRNRGLVPNDLNSEYYSQRASAGLILTEGTLIEPQGTEWPFAPGIWNKKQIAGWKKVVDDVHAKGGLIFCQLWHVGRAQHLLHNCGRAPPAPSAIAARGGKFRLLAGTPSYSVPEAIDDPKEYVQLFKQGALNAKEAGFDGIELHGANGYLPHEFLELHSNKRTDSYGGSVENRCRFVLEIIDEFTKVYDKKHVGIKLTPSGGYNDMGDPEEEAIKTYSHLVSELDKRDIGFIQICRWGEAFDPTNRGTPLDVTKLFRPLIKNALLFLNFGFTFEEAEKWISEGHADAITFARPFIGTPNLPEVAAANLAPQPSNYATYYVVPDGAPWSTGYTDYPPVKIEKK